MDWVLITGGVASGIGKGCLAATFARAAMRGGRKVTYRKVEPCLQGNLKDLGNDAFGEVVADGRGGWWDADAARAAFLLGSREASDISMGRALISGIEQAHANVEPAPRLVEILAQEFVAELRGCDLAVFEVGGTAGELEHRACLESLLRALGAPVLHLHATAVSEVLGRSSMKAAENSLLALVDRPHFVFIRGATTLSLTEHHVLGGAIRVSEDTWPERGWHSAVRTMGADAWSRVRVSTVAADPLFAREDAADVPVRIVADVGHPDAYASLLLRLRAWSRGRIRLLGPSDSEPAMAEVRVGEKVPPRTTAALSFEIVPCEKGLDPRDPQGRPDWLGTADEPSGPLADFVDRLLQTPGTGNLPLAYSDEAFAEEYVEHSMSARLRDHAVIDPLIDRALPVGPRLASMRVLDVGTGWGRWASRLTACGATVVGVEPSQAMCSHARRLGLPRYEVLCGTVHDVPLSGPIGAALACMSLDHEPDLDGALGKIATVLAPRGRLIVATEHPLRTATLTGPRWTDDRSARVRDYVRSGPRDYSWFGRGERVRVIHRPMGEWIAAVQRAGLRILALEEPGEPEVDAGVPRYWLLVAERPGVAPSLVTIDGASGAGKSTLARALGERLGWDVLDTGDLRRAFVLRNAEDETRSARVEWRAGSWWIGAEVLSMERLRAAPISRDELCPSEEDEGAVIARALERPCVAVGRGLGRVLDAGLSVYLDIPDAVRESRSGERIDVLRGRDARDRERGRLLEPDIAALRLDARRSVVDLVSSVVRNLESHPVAME